MTILDPLQELIKGLELAEQMERNRAKIDKEYRIYYNKDGTIVGLWESGYPEGNYIVVQDPDFFHRNNTNLLHVVDEKLQIKDPRPTNIRQLYKSNSGQPVVKGHAAVALGIDEEYLEIEFYDKKHS